MTSTFSGHEGLDQTALGRAVFIDKDGTLVDNVPHNVDPAKLHFLPHALEALRRLASQGFQPIIVTNQPGLAYGMFTRGELTQLQCALTEMMAREGVELAGFYACTHAAGAGPVPACLCRKPAPGLLRQAARAHAIDLQRSWMIGDLLDDIEAGRRAGCRTVLLDVGNETAWRLSPLRTPHHRVPDWQAAADAILAEETTPVPDHATAEPAP